MIMKRTLLTTRRHFFNSCGYGLGKVALASLLAERRLAAASLPDPLAPRAPHFAPRRSPSSSCSWPADRASSSSSTTSEAAGADRPADPGLVHQGQALRLHGHLLEGGAEAAGDQRKFARHGQTGTWVSESFPHVAEVVDDLAFMYAVTTDVFNHAPAKLFCNTGSAQSGRPSMGAWVTYGIGSEARDLPGFVVLQSGPRGPRGGAPLWGSGFLPTVHQGVPFRNVGDPILDIASPRGITAARQRQAIAAVAI
jgi:hypothetical protein